MLHLAHLAHSAQTTLMAHTHGRHERGSGACGCRGSAPGGALPVAASGALDEVLLLLGEDAEERVVGEWLPVILRQPAHVLKLVKRPVGRAVLGVAHGHDDDPRLPTRREKF